MGRYSSRPLPGVVGEVMTDFVRAKRFWIYAKLAEKDARQQPVSGKKVREEVVYCPVATSVAPTTRTELTPLRILFEYDGPRTFTAQIGGLGLGLAHLCVEDGDVQRFVVVPVNESIVNRLVNGALAVRDALMQPWVWIVDIDVDGAIRSTQGGPADRLPDEILPAPGLMLYPRLEPWIRVRMEGSDLQEGQICASVFERLARETQKAMRGLVGIVFDDADTGGRPTEDFRRWTDLPAQAISFGSLSIAFGPPSLRAQVLPAFDERNLQKEREVEERVGELLNAALDWTLSPAAPPPEDVRGVGGETPHGRAVGPRCGPRVLRHHDGFVVGRLRGRRGGGPAPLAQGQGGGLQGPGGDSAGGDS